MSESRLQEIERESNSRYEKYRNEVQEQKIDTKISQLHEYVRFLEHALFSLSTPENNIEKIVRDYKKQMYQSNIHKIHSFPAITL